MIRTRISTVVLTACLGMLIALPAAMHAAEWDQAAVTKIAKELADATGDLRDSVRRGSPPPPGSSQRRVHFKAMDDLRVIQSSINSLSRQLEGGAGRDETFPTFQRIRTLRNDISELAGRADITEPTLGKLEAAGGFLQQLEPYYEGAGE